MDTHLTEKVYAISRIHEGELYVIDVSQSVEHDHPHALEFLRKDCSNITGRFSVIFLRL